MANSNQIASDPNFTVQTLDMEMNMNLDQEESTFDYSKRAQWLRAAVLGANDGLVSTASLMMGVGAVKQDIKAMILTGFAGLVAGACSMAIGEFVSVYSQLDIELAQIKRDKTRTINDGIGKQQPLELEAKETEKLPNPIQAAAASALAFSIGAMVPLLAAAFIKQYRVRVAAVAAAVTVALVFFGWAGSALGKAPWARATVRVTIGGWVAMAITFGLTKLIGSSGL
ncbi:vacuolar iron transporter homolog 2-like [Impatiens glandulifera]|uniref:vacuolar iron transporter homolog 2-like n=1 Tax=Impatiens glandulifera TaxID=253017 RepID=UPI001FB19026|nr:vacuolar iron transporter homolog 2-like [Impatiens glandulifera]